MASVRRWAAVLLALSAAEAVRLTPVQRSATSGPGLPACMEQRLRSFPMDTYGKEKDTRLRKAGLGAIFVAHWKHLADRRERAEQELDKVGVQGTFLTGYDGEELTDEDIACLYPENRVFDTLAKERNMSANWLHTGELSLSFKHVAAAYEAVQHGYQHTLVLEDDFTFEDNFVRRLEELLRNPQSWGDSYDIVYVGSYGHNHRVDLQRPPRSFNDNLNKGTVGYLISLSGARHLLAHMPITCPSDHMIGNDHCGTAPPERWTHMPYLVVPHDDFGTKHVAGEGLATPKKSHYIRTRDILPCVGTKCPCGVPRNMSTWLIGGGCCCHTADIP